MLNSRVDFSKRIGFGKRFGAMILDVLIGGFGGGIFGMVFGGSIGALVGKAVGGEDTTVGGFLGAFIGFLLGPIIFTVVYGLIEGFSGASVGKMILGIKIANEDGTKAKTGKYFSRYLLKNIAFIGAALGYLTGIYILKTIGGYGGLIIFIGCFFVLGASKQSLHDKIVKTAVFLKKDIAPAGAV